MTGLSQRKNKPENQPPNFVKDKTIIKKTCAAKAQIFSDFCPKAL